MTNNFEAIIVIRRHAQLFKASIIESDSCAAGRVVREMGLFAAHNTTVAL